MFGNKWNSPEFPINGIQAVFHEIKGNLGITLIPFQKVPFNFLYPCQAIGSHGHSCHVRESPRKKGGGELYSYIHYPVFVEKIRFISILKKFKKNHKKKIVRVGQSWSDVVGCCQILSYGIRDSTWGSLLYFYFKLLFFI